MRSIRRQSVCLLVNLFVLIPAFCHAQSFSAPGRQGIVGDYHLSGDRQVSSMVRINSDGSYRFQYTAGRIEEQDEGSWTTNGFNLKFSSRSPMQPPSVTLLRSEKVEGPGVRIVFEGDHAAQAAAMLDAVVHTRDRLVPANEISGTRALARDATLPVIKISLSLVGMLREYPKFEFAPSAPDHNQFVLTSAPGNLGYAPLTQAAIKAVNGQLFIKMPQLPQELTYEREKARP